MFKYSVDGICAPAQYFIDEELPFLMKCAKDCNDIKICPPFCVER